MHIFCYNSDMEWATKRKLAYILSFFGIIFIIAGATYFLHIYKPPSCTDGIQNQEEMGVDCGGPCTIICSNLVSQPIILWQRSFESAHGYYNAVAYVENPNMNLGVAEVYYSFKLYDSRGIFIVERQGKTFLVPNERFAIFEQVLSVGEIIPKTTTFTFTRFSPWTKISREKTPLTVGGPQLSGMDTKPKITASLQNKSLVPVKNINVTAVVYDSNENAIGASATVVDVIPPDSSYDIVFTWLQPFSATPQREEIIPRINPFDTSF